MSEQKRNIFFCFENSSIFQVIKNSKTAKKNFLGIESDINKRSHLTKNQSNNKECPKGSINALKTELFLNFDDAEKNRIRNSKVYFAKEKKKISITNSQIHIY